MNNYKNNEIKNSTKTSGAENKKPKLKLSSSGVVAILLSIFILVFSVGSIVAKDVEFSENENRYLSTFPEFSWDDLVSGDYIADVEKYMQDHFPYRDFFVGGKADIELAIGKDENNGVYFTEDGVLIEEFFATSKDELDKRIGYINRFIESLNDVGVYISIAPTSGIVNIDKLPEGAPDDSALEVLEYLNSEIGGEIVELSQTLQEINKVQKLFFETDHHWNTFGAYYAYVEIMESMGENPIPISEYEKVVLSEEFKGTMYSQGGYFNLDGEEFAVLKNKTQSELLVNYVLENKKSDSLFEEKHLSKKDKYAYFTDGNHPLITIENKNAPIDKHILIAKDSYANIMLPFLADSFSKISVVDLRFYSMPLSDYIKTEQVDDVIILYNVKTLMEDVGIFKIK